MKVLSLFDGMSCGRIALERIGIIPTRYYASEIDKYAIQVSQKNYPDQISLGDVTGWKSWDIPWSKIDLILAGSPCQGFSFAGKQLAFDDPRSKLFFTFSDILKYVQRRNPSVKFLLENVKMKQRHLDVITEQLGVEPVFINSALVSPQMRQRWYWCNWSISQPKDTYKRFQDILESDHAMIDKAYALTATYHKKGGEETRQRNFSKSQRPIAWINNTTTRWLTPIECERLQGLPDGYTEGVSNTQRYKMIGNGWQVDTIEHIFKEGLCQ